MEDDVARLSARWTAPVYAFFKTPLIEHENGRRCHTFHCVKSGCPSKHRRFLDTHDQTSTSNMRQHARRCFGPEVFDAMVELPNAKAARPHVEAYIRSGSIDASFERKGKGKLTFSARQHTFHEARYVHGVYM